MVFNLTTKNMYLSGVREMGLMVYEFTKQAGSSSIFLNDVLGTNVSYFIVKTSYLGNDFLMSVTVSVWWLRFFGVWCFVLFEIALLWIFRKISCCGSTFLVLLLFAMINATVKLCFFQCLNLIVHLVRYKLLCS